MFKELQGPTFNLKHNQECIQSSQLNQFTERFFHDMNEFTFCLYSVEESRRECESPVRENTAERLLGQVSDLVWDYEL